MDKINRRPQMWIKMIFVGALSIVLLCGCGNGGVHIKTPDSLIKINPDGGMDPDVNTETLDFSKYGDKQDDA